VSSSCALERAPYDRHGVSPARSGTGDDRRSGGSALAAETLAAAASSCQSAPVNGLWSSRSPTGTCLPRGDARRAQREPVSAEATAHVRQHEPRTMAELLRPPPMGSMKARVATAERAQRSALASPRAASTAGGRPPAHAAASAGAHLRVCRLSAVLQPCRSGNTARLQRGAPLAKLANRLALIGHCCAQRCGSERGAQLVGPPQRVCEVRGQRVQVRSPKGGSAWARKACAA
jgi:hypothetical protein